MKVIIIGTAHPLRGGLAAYNHRLAQAFQEAGHQVRIENFALQYPNFLFPGKTQYSEDPAPDRIEIRSEISSVNPLSWFSVGRRLQNEKPDLVIVKYWLPFMGPCFGTIIRQIKKNHHTQVVSILDNLIPHEKRPGDLWFSKYFIKPVDGFIAQSRSVLQDLQQMDSSKPVKFVPHPIYDNFGDIQSRGESIQKLNLDSEFRYLLFFGFIRDYKGLDLLLQAMSLLKDKLQIKLLIAGEFYNNEKEHLELIDQLDVQDQVILHTHFISNENVKYYFGAADVVVQPYKTATQSGISQMAYHFEKPMIVTNVGGLPEIVPHGKVGYVVEVDPKSIAQGIDRFFELTDSTQFQTQLQSKKQEYSWEAMVKNIILLAKL